MNEPVTKKVYYSIGDVCDLTGLKPHVLRYWETQFEVLRPTKNQAGNRVYRSKEIEVIMLVKRLLYEQKYTRNINRNSNHSNCWFWLVV